MTVRQLSEEDKKSYSMLVTHPIQSWEWGQFRQKVGNQVVRLGVFDKGKLKEAHQLTIHKIPYTPYKLGVLLKSPAPTEDTIDALRLLAQKENLIFARLEPNVVTSDKSTAKTVQLLKKHGARAGRPMFTKETFWIDLTLPEEELLKSMHPKTRYNIRVAQRHGVEVFEDNSKKAFEKYLDLTEQTTKRQGFYAHTARYHRLMWETLRTAQGKPRPSHALAAHLLTARYQSKILITWILFAFGNTLYYPYGASSDKYRNVMASHLMMWEAIRFGKKLGLQKLDLWGKEEGKGFTRFKEGFGPQTIELIGTWDLVFQPSLYTMYRAAEDLRWKFLKFAAFLPLPKPSFR